VNNKLLRVLVMFAGGVIGWLVALLLILGVVAAVALAVFPSHEGGATVAHLIIGLAAVAAVGLFALGVVAAAAAFQAVVDKIGESEA